MNDEIIKEALSYDLGSDLHETWRVSRKNNDGKFEPRIKKSMDETWNLTHGTDVVDIANCSFSELPSNWQYENLEAAKLVINLVYDRVVAGKPISDQEKENMAAVIHDEWLKRNSWVYDSKLTVPYRELSKEEQDKDMVQLELAIKKVQDYLKGLIIIDDICNKYELINSSKSL